MEIKHSYRQVDYESWSRREAFELFGQGEYPFVGLTSGVDVTRLRQACEERGKSNYVAFMFVIMACLNEIQNFRYRIYEDQIILCETVDPSFNLLDPDSETFYFVTAPMAARFSDFDAGVAAAKKAALERRERTSNRLDLVHVSSLPWFGPNDLIQPMGLSAGSTIPRCVWGRADDNGKTVTVPFSVTGHHGLFDGKHISRLLTAVAQMLDKPEFLDR